MKRRRANAAPTPLDMMAFAVTVETALAEREIVRQSIAMMGMALARHVYGPGGVMPLREASRQCGLSPGYLSAIQNGRYRISPKAYLRIASLIREPK